MTQFSPSDDQSIDPACRQQLCELLARLCDDDFTEEDGILLNQLLNEEPAARRYYLRYIAVHSALTAISGSSLDCAAADHNLAIERMALERFSKCTATDASNRQEVVHRTRESWSAMQWAASAVAVLLFVVAAVWWGHDADIRDRAMASDANEHSKQMNIATNSDESHILVAEVTFVSDGAVWQNPNGSYAVNARVASGQDLTLERGRIELTYSSGAKLLLTGPSEFLALPTGGKLRRGELVARVPEAGHGFTIETPHGKVIDLGTEFGVVVDDFGVSQVSVFEGKVETLPTRSSGVPRDKFELTSGRAIQWTDAGMIPIAPRGSRYGRPANEQPTNQFSSQIRASINEQFQGEALAPDVWKSIGDVALSETGLRLGSEVAADERPYLITAQEFDPSQGAVTIICDVRFENLRSDEEASFSVLTRGSDQRSKPNTPWHDLLSRSMRCRIMANSLSGEGKLEAGAKYEADREQTNISWGGFSRPQPDTLYRVEMRDDGLNVSFTVSVAENPSVRKTIICRSLFRGNQNFVALEGSRTGTAVVERVKISQEGPSMIESHLTGSNVDDVSVESIGQNLEAKRQLDAMSPDGEELLLRDDFDDGTLDSRTWTTLGDVVVKDDQVQLGLPNDEEHIDTWRARPYLITKRAFDSSNGALTIVGKATFAPNFLHGYGGSFAVMTRAEDSLGDGPGWENSILRRGVRSNFWPAAYGLEHSLEIHEKPAANIVMLLAAENFQISPNSRTYLFRVVDDGRSATLTFVDAANPATRKTLSHATTSTNLSGGKIGFESCWGSPVLLDNIRIYQNGN